MKATLVNRNLITATALLGSGVAIAALFLGAAHSAMLMASGNISGAEFTITRSRWEIVAGSIAVFLAFLALIPVRLKGDWRSHGVYGAFIVSLFAEMFGFPLSVFFLSSILGFTLLEREFMAYMYSFGMPLGSLVTFIGVVLIILGWREVYRAKDKLATEGIYKYVRHPQYLGILLVTVGWIIHWPTLPGVALWPAITILYVRLAKREDSYLAEKYGESYRRYAERTPMLVPLLRSQR